MPARPYRDLTRKERQQKYSRVDVARHCGCGCGAVVMGCRGGRLVVFSPGHSIKNGSPVLRSPERLRFPEDIAWAAGIFEGEGWFSGAPRLGGRVWYANAGIKMNDRDILERFYGIVQLGVLTGPRRHSHAQGEYWEWKVARHEDVEQVALLFARWLGPRRLVQAATVLARDTRRLRHEPAFTASQVQVV